MTREEAILLVTNCTINSYDYDNLKFAVNKIYDDFESKFTRVEIISSLGRVFCDRCSDNRHYELSIQDDKRTLKIFEVKDKQ